MCNRFAHRLAKGVVFTRFPHFKKWVTFSICDELWLDSGLTNLFSVILYLNSTHFFIKEKIIPNNLIFN